MRALVALTLATAACASSAPAGQPAYDSVRDRLAEGPAQLYITGAASSGSVTARRWTPDGWVEGVTAVTVETGELRARATDSALSLDAFEVSLAPIAIPEEVFNKPASLDDVRIKLAQPTTGVITWTSDDDATAQLTLALDLDWAIAIDGGKTPLGTQHLPPITIDVAFSGSGDQVDAAISLAATGKLWNWAGLLELTAIDLALEAETVD